MATADLTEIDVSDDSLDLVTSMIQYEDHHDWITWAWAHLARVGDVPGRLDEEDPGYVAGLISLAGLRCVFERFHDVHDFADGNDELMIELIDTVRPGITEVEIARYCERHDHHDDTGDAETGWGLVQVAVTDRADQLRVRLIELIGAASLFTSLYVSRGHRLLSVDDDASIDSSTRIGSSLAPEAFDPYMDEVLNSGITPGKQRAYMWLEDKVS